MHKKLFLGAAVLLSPLLADAFLPCGTTAPGVLNVGILPDNLPFSDLDSVTNSAIGFDPLFITAVAKLLGYETINFIGYGSNADGLDALASGEIDVYANSNLLLTTTAPFNTIGVVTDITDLIDGEAFGWQLNPGCCGLALALDAAVTYAVENGTYGNVLQQLRADGLTNGATLGVPLNLLLAPFPFASTEIGTIPPICGPADPAALPATNCISAYLQAHCAPANTFTGATAQIPSVA